MSRDEYDIPEVFRRAMEEAGWDTSRKDDEGGQRPPLPPRPEGDGRPNRLIVIAGLVLGAILLVGWLANVYTEWLWFNSVDYQGVWLTQWAARLGIFVFFFGLALLILLLNWLVARRRALRHTPPFNPKFLQIPHMKWLITGIAAFIAFGFASSIAIYWSDLLRYLHRVPYGLADPIFSRDISFYLFELPLLTLVQQWFVSLLVITLMGVIAIYAANHVPEIQRGTWRPHESKIFRQHVALLAALILALWTVGYLFDLFELVYSSRGVAFGASYTDLNVQVYAIYAQMLFMGLAALAMLLNAFRFDLRPLLITAALWLAATLILGSLVPGFVQRYSVEPNELVRETPYIAHNIAFTRLGFGLDEIETRPYELGAPLTSRDIERNTAIVKNIRLWDYRPLQATYKQLQELRTYYQIGEIDIDRYQIGGESRQVMLAARELNKAGLETRTWVNTNLVFTHGYGVVMNPVNEFTTEGQPIFFIKDLPPQSTVPEIDVTRPEIYFGELTTDVVFVNSRQEEFDYPLGTENAYTRYAGQGGVLLDSYWKRLAFAIRLGDFNILLSNDIDDTTQVLLHRQVQERIRQIAPFLLLDQDPYLVVTDNGRLVWLQDAYTISDRFPYSEPATLAMGNLRYRVNYMRNAAKIVVDAYEGTVSYYIADPDDPLIQAYAGAFPGLFQPLNEMPANLRRHLRYPVDMFSLQTKQYLRYHMTDTRVFYNQEDVWQLPQELYTVDGTANSKMAVEPYYVSMPLPGEADPEYLLIQPYTPLGKDNMVAWLAARNDVPNYGELVVYELPKQELVFGPLQIEGRIDQEPEISEQFSLWNQSGSRVIRGNLLVIPMNGRFLYVEPIYLLSETNALPELKRVIVATDARIEMATTLAGALAVLLDAAPETLAEAIGETLPPLTEPSAGTGDTAVPLDATITALITSANAHYEAAQTALRNGDWATYGDELEALQQDLAQLMTLVGEE
ncbi:MAG: UPF0182 family protein [Chloroflexi bacterium]|nr:UPF0182 family protein [Ardenticatenaceae bacterium]NOG33815.1 UPF0182 family protein [Chloroflexota bacterium]GIK54400.1 MAG: UPF0182 protein [Chloroflexota bacterium]